MNPADLERHVDRALKATPAPRAPETLLPAVMLAVRAAALKPWYARPWANWPRAWQAASAAVLVLLVAGGVLLWPAAQSYVGPMVAMFDTVLQPVSWIASRVETFVVVMEIVSRTVLQSIVGIVLALFVIMLATSVAVGAAIGRVALGGARQ